MDGQIIFGGHSLSEYRAALARCAHPLTKSQAAAIRRAMAALRAWEVKHGRE